MWIFYFVFWTAVRASAEEPLYKKIGDEAVLTPDSVENPITNIRWKHDDNIAMQWYGDETSSYRQFKDRGSLDISTGVMTITGLTQDDSGIYTVEINGKETSKTQLHVISPVPKPIIYVSCDTEMTYCVFTCSGSITGAEPVTYWWTAGGKRLNSTKELRITKEEEEQWFSCTLENPVSSNSSEKIFNPFMEIISDQELRRSVIALGVLLFVYTIIIIIIIIYLRYKYKKAAEPQEWSTTLKPTTAAFWREKRNDKSVYSVTKDSIRSRVALLINNIEFTDEVMNRRGAEKDEENMEKLLTALGYEVVKYRNLTGKKIEEAVIKFSKHPKLRETDSVFVVIMSHGELGAVLGVDYKKGDRDREQDNFPIDNIYKHLDTEHCPELLNKPKIIIIQADRGEMDRAVLVSDYAQQSDQSLSAGDEDIKNHYSRRAHIEKDFICFLSCTSGTISYRHTDKGSLLIQYIVDVLNTFAHQDHIEELFRRVMQRFDEDFPSLTEGQMPTKDRCTLTKKFFLFPREL